MGLTGRRKTREDRWVESFFQTARSLSGVAWSRLYSAWPGRDPSRLNWENSVSDEFDGGDVTEGVVEGEEVPSDIFFGVSNDAADDAAVVASSFPTAAVPDSALFVVVAAALPPEALTESVAVTVAVVVGTCGCGGLGPLFL